MIRKTLVVTLLYFMIPPGAVWGMHISDGILPVSWASLWWVLALPFLVLAFRRLGLRQNEGSFQFTALIGAAVFLISCMPIPIPITGTTSHPAGVAMAVIMIGPRASIAVAAVSLLLQALFLAHGGLTTFGANVFSMGIIGVFTAYLVFRVSLKAGAGLFASSFLAGMISHFAVYLTTSTELALALHGNVSFWHFLAGIIIAFTPTQLPLGIIEGGATAFAAVYVYKNRPDILYSIQKSNFKEAL